MESKIFLYDHQIGEKIRFYRKRRGLTQSALARRVGISAQQLQKYEIGRNRISASRVKILAEILDVPVHYFLMDGRSNSKDKPAFNDIAKETGANKLLYYYSMIKSEKIRKLLVSSSATYVESGL